MKLNAQGWIEFAAEVAHEANRAYCTGIGDNSQMPWKEAPANIRASARAGAEAIAKNPDTSPEASHANWSAFKLADGWTYGPEKDLEAKTHPCLVPYAELPPEQRVKDYIFGAVVRAVLGL